jgi:hypothetical protein
MPAPFTNLPLKVKPYYSRISNQTTNYPMLAFTPGYALQASELNEIQENFFVQQTLSNGMLANWPLTGETGSGTLGYPMWNGAVPFDRTQVTYTNSIVTVNVGWYLITFSNSLKIWLYKDTLSTISINQQGQVGLVLDSPIFIPCSVVSGNEGYNFTDNSSGLNNQNSCGAHRYKINIANSLQFSTGTTNYPLVNIVTVGTTLVCQYLNNLKIG